MFLLALREVCRMDHLQPLLVGDFFYCWLGFGLVFIVIDGFFGWWLGCLSSEGTLPQRRLGMNLMEIPAFAGMTVVRWGDGASLG